MLISCNGTVKRKDQWIAGKSEVIEHAAQLSNAMSQKQQVMIFISALQLQTLLCSQQGSSTGNLLFFLILW